jgi:hypothetical protein
MRQFAIAVLCFFFAFVSLAEAEGLKSFVPNSSAEEQVAKRLCYAGRYKVTKIQKTDLDYKINGTLIEQVASSSDHPNAVPWNAPLLSDGNKEGFEEGKTYCLIVTDGSLIGKTIVAMGEDTPQNLWELKRLIQSKNAYQNSKEWSSRRALWKGFGKDVGFKQKISLYGENEKLDRILYILRNEKDGWPTVYFYDLSTAKSDVVTIQKILNPQINRITYEQGQFIIWANGQVELYLPSS